VKKSSNRRARDSSASFFDQAGICPFGIFAPLSLLIPWSFSRNQKRIRYTFRLAQFPPERLIDYVETNRSSKQSTAISFSVKKKSLGLFTYYDTKFVAGPSHANRCRETRRFTWRIGLHVKINIKDVTVSDCRAGGDRSSLTRFPVCGVFSSESWISRCWGFFFFGLRWQYVNCNREMCILLALERPKKRKKSPLLGRLRQLFKIIHITRHCIIGPVERCSLQHEVYVYILWLLSPFLT